MTSKTVIAFLVLLTTLCTLLMNGCRKDPVTTTPLIFQSPSGFPTPAYNLAAMPFTEEGFQLGKRLFFDGRLSADGVQNCGACHQPLAAFTTFEHDRSHGLNFYHTLRNAPGLFNLAWVPTYNQDGSANTLAEVYRNHITHPEEMGESIPNVLKKLQADAGYRQQFRTVFGDEKVTEERLYNVLTQFVLNLVSANAKYDKVKRGEAVFTSEEQSGYSLFQSKCAACHREPLFTDFSYRNNGLPHDPALNDRGRRRVTGNAADDLKFRVPSLRNLELTSYYGHDGRFSVFRMMLQHYRNGIAPSPTLDPLLNGGIAMTASEENAVVAFLRTLSDSAFLNNPRFRP